MTQSSPRTAAAVHLSRWKLLMPDIIAISNQKGGVGKTTTAVNIAACLAAAGHSTLLVDMDPQSNATSACGLDPNNLEASVYEALLEGKRPTVYPLTENFPNLHILPATMDLAGAEYELIDLPNRDYALQNALNQLETDFEYVIIDCPPSLGLLTVNVLAVADWVLVPVQAEYFALEGLSRMILTIQRINRTKNPRLRLLGVIVTMFDGRTNLANQVVEELVRAFPDQLLSTRIQRSIRLSEAPSFGKPIIYYDSRSPGAFQYMSLSEEILHVCQEARAGSGA
jgi:chromosome partitioning protein